VSLSDPCLPNSVTAPALGAVWLVVLESNGVPAVVVQEAAGKHGRGESDWNRGTPKTLRPLINDRVVDRREDSGHGPRSLKPIEEPVLVLVVGPGHGAPGEPANPALGKDPRAANRGQDQRHTNTSSEEVLW